MIEENKRTPAERSDMNTTEATESTAQHVNSAVSASASELMLLANFYHEHGLEKSAKEVYEALLKVRSGQDRDRRRA